MTLRRQTGQTHVTARLRPRPVGDRDALPAISPAILPSTCDLLHGLVFLIVRVMEAHVLHS